MPDDEKTEQAPDLAAELAQARQEIDRLKERDQVYAKTLEALRTPPTSGQPVPTQQVYQRPAHISPQDRDAIKAELADLGFDDKAIEQHWRIIAAFMRPLARPYENALGTLANEVDYTKVRLTKSDYAEIEKDVEEEFKNRVMQGRPTSRADIYEMVRARPEWVQKSVEKEVARKSEEEKRRATESASASTEKMTQAKPGEHAFTKPSKPLSKEGFEALSLEDKEKYLDSLGTF